MARTEAGTTEQARDLVRMRQRLDDWRKGNARGVAFPDKLWRSAGRLGQRLGIELTAGALWPGERKRKQIGGASETTARDLRDGACPGAGVQQAQAGQWRGGDVRRWEQSARGSQGGKVHRVGRLSAGEYERVPIVAAGAERGEAATGDGAKRRHRSGVAVVPVGLGGVAVIQLTAQMRILVAVASIDFRAGIDGLARVCRAHLQADPFCGSLFVFCNRRRTAIKILTYDAAKDFGSAINACPRAAFRTGRPARRSMRCRPISCRFC